MLILSRTVGEKLNIGHDITIEVRRVAGNRVHLGVAAPQSVRVRRGELRLHEFPNHDPNHDPNSESKGEIEP